MKAQDAIIGKQYTFRHSDQELRCCCGKLLAKLTKDGVIIRCARCKREMVVSLADLIVNLDTGWSKVSFKEKTA